MAKKQTRRSISLSRATYERLKVFCETNGTSMSQFVETRVGDFLGRSFGPEQLPPSARPAGEPLRETAVQAAIGAASPELRHPVAAPMPRPAPVPAAKPPAAPTMTADSIFTF
jgi:hypothetical protein